MRPLLVVLRALGLGDLLTAVPALRGLAKAFPDHHRVLAAPAPLAPLAALTGALHGTVPVDELAPLPPSLHGADIAVNLHGSGPESHRVLLAADPCRLIAFAHPALPETWSCPPWTGDDVHEVVRWCDLLALHGIPADRDALDLPPPPGVTVPPEARGATVIHPGAASRARQWPPERFGAVARAEAEAGRTVVVTAGPGEKSLLRAVLRGAYSPAGEDPTPNRDRRRVAPAGPTDLLSLAAFVAAAGRVVCGDTGVAHLATALGTPSIVLFGPTSPERWGPPARRRIHRVLWGGTTGSPHADRPDPGLLQIDVADVLDALDGLPDDRSPRHRGIAR